MSGMHLSKEFFELLKAIGESKSKQEEDRIIQKEIATLKKKMETPVSKGPVVGAPAVNALNANRKKAREFLVRMLYVEMLGHDASFGYIKAVELAASSSIVHKRTGYLLCSCTLSPEHEFRFMLVNQMQRDLASSSVLEICAALIAVTNLITSDMVPAIQFEVVKMLDHANESVRKKAVIALHRFYQLAPESVEKGDLTDKLRKVLCDRDPSVMGSCLNVMESMAMVDPLPFKDLVPSLISILKQVIEHRLPSDYDYHRVPAPWIQMKIVRILAVLGKNDANASNGMYEILGECMKKADVGINAGYAVVYECVRTITAIYPNSTLLDAAAEAIARFMTSKSQNLKYFGVTGLAAIVESHPQYAEAHQMTVIDCLEDRDETLQRRTLDLLYKMTNPMNVQFITEKLLHFLRGTTDAFLKEDLTTKVCRLAERYAPNNLWYIETITELFEISGDLVSKEVAQNLMSLIAEGEGEDEGEEADMLLRQHSVAIYANLLEGNHAKLPQLLIETMAWVLGEYAYLSVEWELDEILEKLCMLLTKGKTLEASTRKTIVSSIMKLVAQAGTCPPLAAKVIDDFTKSKDTDIQQRCLEFQNLITTAPHLLGEVLPVDASCEDVQVDPNLSFMNMFVQQAIADGAKPYEKPEDDDDDDDYESPSKANKFKFDAYEKPTKPGAVTSASISGFGSGMPINAGSSNGVTPPPGGFSQAQNNVSTTVPQDPAKPQLMMRNVANVWGKGGMNQGAPAVTQTSATAAPTPAPAPSNVWNNTSSYTSKTAAAPEAASVAKTQEQIRKEQMAAALFGGAPPPGSPPSTPGRSAIARRKTARAARAAAAAPPVSPTPAARKVPSAPGTPVVAAPAPPPPPPAPEMDLLDLMSDPAPTASQSTPSVDVFGNAPIPVAAPSSQTAPPPDPEPEPEPPAVEVDPFAASGLLDGVSDAPISALMTNNTFQHNGSSLVPLTITTPQFGQKWGGCPHTTPLSVLSTSKVSSLESYMNFMKPLGFHPVESIVATNEGICAGMIGGGVITILVHAKVTLLGSGQCKINATIKATDATVGGCLAMFLQNMMG